MPGRFRWRMGRICAGSALLLSAAGPLQAALPAQTTSADVTAHYQDNAIPSAPVSDPWFSDVSAITGSAPPVAGNYALANATGAIPSALGGPKVDGYAEIQGAGFNAGPQTDITLGATSDARIVVLYTVNSPTPGPVDVDLRILLDGRLGGGNYFTSDPSTIHADVAYTVTAHSASTIATAFAGSARLGVGTFSTVLTTTGDWSEADFPSTAPPPGGLQEFQVSTNTDRAVGNVLTVNPGEQIAIEVHLTTEVYAAGPYEAQAIADFNSTGRFGLSSDVPGVTFALVPEPAVTAAAGIVLVVAARRRRARLSSSGT